MDVQWNTGSHYTAEGQIIRAKLMDDGFIHFNDFSRGIWGKMNLPKLAPHREMVLSEERHFKEWVHGKYLRNDYELTFERLERKS